MYLGNHDMGDGPTDGCLQITLPGRGRPLMWADEFEQKSAIQHLQNKMLGYRLENFQSVRSSVFDVPQFVGATRRLARNLGACLVGAPELQDRLITVLKAQDEGVRMARSEEPEAIVLEALLLLCHQRRKIAYVAEIALATNKILFARRQITLIDGPDAVRARKLGGKLKSLGFHTVRLDAAGRGIAFDPHIVKRIHELARLNGTATALQGLPGCPYCQEFSNPKE